MTKICEWNGCELLTKQNEVENFIDKSFDSGLKFLQLKYPNHNKNCLQRIYAERLKLQHHYLLGELIDKNLITKRVRYNVMPIGISTTIPAIKLFLNFAKIDFLIVFFDIYE